MYRTAVIPERKSKQTLRLLTDKWGGLSTILAAMVLIHSTQKVIISPQLNEHTLSDQEDGMKEAFEKIEVLSYSLCDDCNRRSASCSECRCQNNQRLR